jgi:cell division protein FtsQ
MSVPLPPDRRFLRARARPATAPWRRPWRVVACAALAVVAIAAVLLSLGSGRFRESLTVRAIIVAGHTWQAPGELRALLEDRRGTSLMAADLEHWRARVLGSPWVLDASLRRRLPSTVIVTVVEREPMALARIGGELYLVDRDATVLGRFGPPYAALDLPVVDGLAVRRADRSIGIDAGRAALVVRLLASLEERPGLAARISQIDVTDPHDVAVLLRDDPARLRLGGEAFVSRLQTYLEIAGALRDRVAGVDYVDLRFEDRVFLMPRATHTPPAPAATRGGRGAAATGGRG